MRAPDHASETEALTPASHPNLGAGLLTPHPTLSRRHLYAHPGSDRCATPLVPAARTLHPSEGAPLRRAPRPPARRREAAPPPDSPHYNPTSPPNALLLTPASNAAGRGHHALQWPCPCPHPVSLTHAAPPSPRQASLAPSTPQRSRWAAGDR